MKKVFLWLLIVSMISVFSLAGCKTEIAEEEAEKLAEEPGVEEIMNESGEETLDKKADKGAEEEALDKSEAKEIDVEIVPEGKIAFWSDLDGNP